MRIAKNLAQIVVALLTCMALTGTTRAQTGEPIRIGLLTVKTGPLATGGIQMEQGLNVYLEEHGGRMAGRPVELIVADTGGSPAIAKTKAQELVERDRRRCDHRAAGGLRSACDQRLHRRGRRADAEHCRGRGHDATDAESVFHSRIVELGASIPSDGSLCRRRSRLSPCRDDW